MSTSYHTSWMGSTYLKTWVNAFVAYVDDISFRTAWHVSEIIQNSLIDAFDLLLTSIWSDSSKFCICIDLYRNTKVVWSEQKLVDASPKMEVYISHQSEAALACKIHRFTFVCMIIICVVQWINTNYVLAYCLM